jgi:NADH-quinone oxidoreductase subunit G
MRPDGDRAGEMSPPERLAQAMNEATVERGVSVLPAEAPVRYGSLDWLAPFLADGPQAGHCDVLVTGSVFGADRLANYGEPGRDLSPAPCAWMHPLDAGAVGVEDGQTILLPLDQGVTRTTLRCRTDMARHTLVLPKMPDSGWQFAGAMASTIALERLWREEGDEETAAAARADAAEECPGGKL